MHLSKDKKNKLFFYFLLFILLGTQITKNQESNKNSITDITQIQVFGLSEVDNFEISQKFQSLLFENIFLINKKKFKEILSQNNLVESFNIKKLYPNIIQINIQKTNFLALTFYRDEIFFIGSNGKLVKADNNENFQKKLPFVFSNGNYRSFLKLKKIIDKSEFDYYEIESFYHFPSSRWDIKTKNGLLIRLPEYNVFNSLQYVNLIKLNNEFKKNKIIDLRIPKKIIFSNE